MMNRKILLYNAAFTYSWIPLGIFKKLEGNRLIVPVYHLVTDKAPDHIKHLYNPRSIKVFKNDLEFFASHYPGLSTNDLRSFLNDPHSPEPDGFILTFDDGLREVYEIIAPFLYQMGIPAIFFVNNNFIGNRDMFYRFKASILIEEMDKHPDDNILKKLSEIFELKSGDLKSIRREILSLDYSGKDLLDIAAGLFRLDFNEYLSVKQPYMDESQIIELQEKGFVIGAHSLDHQVFSDFAEDEMLENVRISMDKLTGEFAPPLRCFAFPFTDFKIPARILENMHDPEHPVVDASFGTAGLRRDVVQKHIQRIPMEISGIPASQILKAEYSGALIRRYTGMQFIKRND